MAELCRAYWYPLYAHVRRAGYSAEDAEDLTQMLFESLIKRNTFERIRPEGGRLRSYLLKAMNNLLSTAARDSNRQKRGGQVSVEIDQASAEQRYQIEPHDTGDPEILYERRWAITLMDNVLSQLQLESVEKGKEKQFEIFRPLFVPGGPEVSHRELAEKLGVSEGTARVSLFRMRQRYGDLLRATISDTVVDPSEVADEISHLMSIFRSTTEGLAPS
ncbi:MAG: sigma-70 family RNA polymerase sigma factor [Verrucomicrobiae bacterium]|nr:sigma-70 family RNA polymerase sigma factor [Verrucomicrobiae bacterium]